MIKNQWLFPATECVHIVSFAVSIGTIAAVDLSLLDLGLGRKATVPMWRSCRLWTLTGFVLIVFSGLLLFATDPDHYYGASARADSFNACAPENEMFCPTITPGVEQSRYFSSQGIDARKVGPFAQVTAMTCQR